ncbi:uncharacterized protein LOC109801819 [Cajanus cajan]|uniref:Uncharacterized protein n=1 Tax=Cajanus cajan TaxID=3821 RepID=A0A151TD65_CAJCA|nr:uncharacterized protein LOC109801819 [Cajanus cajan]KYP64991.1 hypothetical protein KK1_019605 [Cajanus cajan]
MEATNLGCCKLSWGSSISKYLTIHRTQRHMVRRRCECGDQKDRWGKLVDESMIVLRWRIKEMKRLEANEEAPYDWFEWEKRYYGDYDQHVFQTMELLQCYLMGLRPSVALGMLVLIALSVIMSSGVVFFHALVTAKSLILSCFGSRR